MARKTITPQAHLRTWQAALRVAIEKGMTSEAKQANAMIKQIRATIARQNKEN